MVCIEGGGGRGRERENGYRLIRLPLSCQPGLFWRPARENFVFNFLSWVHRLRTKNLVLNWWPVPSQLMSSGSTMLIVVIKYHHQKVPLLILHTHITQITCLYEPSSVVQHTTVSPWLSSLIITINRCPSLYTHIDIIILPWLWS